MTFFLFKLVKEAFEWLIDEFRSDFVWLKKVVSVKNDDEADALIRRPREWFAGYTLKSFLKETWMLWILLVLTFCVGYMYAGWRLENRCNEFIYDNCWIQGDCDDMTAELISLPQLKNFSALEEYVKNLNSLNGSNVSSVT